MIKIDGKEYFTKRFVQGYGILMASLAFILGVMLAQL